MVWLPAPNALDIESHQVDVWRVSLELATASVKLLGSYLSADESQRAAQLHFPEDRKRFITAHGCLRDILARYLHCEPRQLTFSTGEHGKPALTSHKGINFNLAHSGDYALIAITRGRRVGVDVERVRQDLEMEKIARRYFSKREVSELMALPQEDRKVAFFNCWTRKEAYIKAHGLGLSQPLDSFDVSLSPGKPTVLRATRPDLQEAARWSLESLVIDSQYPSAVAVEGQGLEIRLWDWNL